MFKHEVEKEFKNSSERLVAAQKRRPEMLTRGDGGYTKDWGMVNPERCPEWRFLKYMNEPGEYPEIKYSCGWDSCGQTNVFLGKYNTAATCAQCGRINRFVEPPAEEKPGMNYSTAIFLINDEVQMVACSYELDHNEEPNKLYNFKSFDKTLKVGDFVIVPTDTRHNLTVVRVEELDVEPNLETSVQFKWIVGKVDLEDHEALLAQEDNAVAQIKRAEKQRRRRELRESMLADMDDAKLLALPLSTVPPVELKDDEAAK